MRNRCSVLPSWRSWTRDSIEDANRARRETSCSGPSSTQSDQDIPPVSTSSRPTPFVSTTHRFHHQDGREAGRPRSQPCRLLVHLEQIPTQLPAGLMAGRRQTPSRVHRAAVEGPERERASCARSEDDHCAVCDLALPYLLSADESLY